MRNLQHQQDAIKQKIMFKCAILFITDLYTNYDISNESKTPKTVRQLQALYIPYGGDKNKIKVFTKT